MKVGQIFLARPSIFKQEIAYFERLVIELDRFIFRFEDGEFYFYFSLHVR